MARIGYARLTPPGLNDEPTAADALAAAGCETVYVDAVTGKLADRSQLAAALAHLQQGDQLVTPRLADPARSLADLVGLVADLDARGVALVSLADNINTTSPQARKVFAALANADRALRAESTTRARRAPRPKGADKGGRPPTVTADKIATAKAMITLGEHTMDEIARAVGVSRSTLYRHLTPD
jgi:DNA invertase Pin-like site-specific DNA recombinase